MDMARPPVAVRQM